MFTALRTLLTRWLGPSDPADRAVSAATGESLIPESDLADEHSAVHVPYDEKLLERARTQWQFGEWESLAELELDQFEHHPERGKIALLTAAGLIQTGEAGKARAFVRLAQDWGVTKKMISRVLIAGVHNTLGRAAAANGQEQRALGHFEASVATGTPGVDARLMGETRIIRESTKMGLLPQAAKFIGSQLNHAKKSGSVDSSRLSILETELELVNHELSLALQRNQLTHRNNNHGNLEEGSAEWLAALKQKAVSQLGQDLWVLEISDYKRNGFFVEFGATDGILLSNTWLLEKEFGWQGICAEPNPVFYERLKRNRSCFVSNQYIGRTTGEEVEFIFADAYGGSVEYADDDSHMEKRRAYQEAGHTAMVTSTSLHDFLIQHNAPEFIDYISIDTEGSEYEILRDFPFDKWDIRLLTVEHNFTEKRKDIQKLLESHGYKYQKAQFDDWFEKVRLA